MLRLITRNRRRLCPAEKISTIPMMTEANQPQFSRPIMHMKPVPMTASVATAIPIGPVSAASTVSSMVWMGDKSCARTGVAKAAKVVETGKRRLRRCLKHAKFPCFTEDR